MTIYVLMHLIDAMQVELSVSAKQVVWVARHSHIGDAFFDLDAGGYLLDELRGDAAISDTLVSILVFSCNVGWHHPNSVRIR